MSARLTPAGGPDHAPSTRRTAAGAQRAGWSRCPVVGDGSPAYVADRRVFGDLADDERFVAAYRRALASLHLHGARATLERLRAGW